MPAIRPSIQRAKPRVETALDGAAKGPALMSGETADPAHTCCPLPRTEAEAKALKDEPYGWGDSKPLPATRPSAAPSALDVLLNRIPGPGSPGYRLDAPSAPFLLGLAALSLPSSRSSS